MTEANPSDDAADRQALLELLLADEGIEITSAGIVRRDSTQPAALSYAQQRMWFLEQFENDSSALCIHACVALRGRLDPEALRSSLNEIFRRHDVLRTLIVSDAGQPRPVIAPGDTMPLRLLDVDGDDAALAEVLAAEAVRRFDLEHEPPIMATLVRVADDHHALSVAMHHVASDHSSLDVFFREMAVLYDGFASGRPATLAPLAVQYEDYAAWQHGAGADVYERQLAYWRGQLGDGPAVFEIPPDHRRPARHAGEGATVAAVVPTQVTDQLRELCRRSGSTMFMALLAGFEVVAARHAGETDVVIGLPIAGRVRNELEPMIGAFLNSLVLRVDLADRPTFRALLDRVRENSISAFANQDVPFELVLADLQPARDLSRTPVFQIMFNMIHLDANNSAYTPGGLHIETLEPPVIGANFDLTMYVNENRDGVEMRLVYNRALYEHEHMERLVEQYLHLLAQVAEQPDRPIDEYSLVGEHEAGITPDVTAALDPAWHGSVPDLVRRVAERAPERLAVVDGESRWTYGQLDAQSSRLAGWLRRRGIGRGDVVAIYAHRSGALPLAITGALASGAVYVVLDSRYPPARLAHLLRIADPRAWIALAGAGSVPDEVVAALDDLGVDHRLTLPSVLDEAALEHHLGPRSAGEYNADAVVIGPDDPACLTFTSGSTGTPKAVVGRHGSLTHFLPWMSDDFGVSETDRFSMLSGLSHDPLQRDIFWPLSLGATIVVPDADQIADPGYLARWMHQESVTVAHLTPAMGQLLTDTARSGLAPGVDLDDLRVALFIGDVLTHGQVARLRSLAPNAGVINLYGTTETQRASGYHVVPLDAPVVPEGVTIKEVLPLGVGMPGSQLLVRNPAGIAAAVGEVGEVVMRSPHLALGYWHDDDLTARRFEIDPHGGTLQYQLYATGDRGRYRADGSVEFLGRNDQQVQLRGFRIELGEVAAALRQQAGIADAVVDLRTDDAMSPRLVAFVVAAPSGHVEPAALIRSLRLVLPAHMVPSDIVELDRIPMTPNGKLDRRALHSPASSGPLTDAAVEAPRDALEHDLAEIWQAVLGRDDISVHHDFFALGGYSLLATRVVALIDERLGTRLPVSTLFEYPTIAELATAIRDGAWRSSPVAPVVAADPSQPAVLSYAQERMWFIDQFDAEMSALAVRAAVALRGPLDTGALRRALDEIYERHVVLRTVVVADGGVPRPQVLAAGPMPFDMVDAVGDETVLHAILAAEATRTFDLETEPPIHATLVRVADDHHVLSVVMHHVASDGGSVGVFFRELGAGYSAFRVGGTSPLVPLPVQYQDYAAWQRHDASAVFDEQLEYWRKQLAGPLPVFEIPPDRSRPARHSFSGATVTTAITPQLADRLTELSKQTNATQFMVLLAAFKVVVSRHADLDDVVIGAPIAGRVRPELESMIGTFLNTLVLRTDLSGDPTFVELVGRVRETTLAAYDHQDVPFELLLNDLKPPRDISRTPIFQIMFNMIHLDPGDALDLGGLRTEIVELPDAGSKFDLTMYVNNVAGAVTLRLVYNSELFDHAHMERLLQQYVHLLEQVVRDPGVAIARLSLVTPGDDAVVAEPTASLDHTWHGSVPAAVRRVAERAAGRLAVADATSRWSYGLLATHMTRLAWWLRVRRIGRGDVVAIYGHRSGSLVWTVTGVLASGAVYLLLDPRYPPSRLAQLLRIAKPSAILALDGAGPMSREVLDALDDLGVDARLHVPERPLLDDAALDGCFGAASPSQLDAVAEQIDTIGPDDAACLTFTSGSTGVPKGVVGRHGSLTHFVPWMSDAFDVGEDDRFAMLSGLSHDPLQRDMFWPLWLGAAIIVPDPDSMGTAGWLASWLRDEKITVAHLTPAMGRLVMEGTRTNPRLPITMPDVRNALFIGDVLTRGQVADLVEVMPNARIVNLYGTTETQRASGYHVVTDEIAVADDRRAKEVLPLGVGMPGTQLLVRSASGRSAAVGEIGEIVMRSPHLALGYWNDDELTAQRFESDPFGADASDQLYSTGDRGRYRADGSVEFLGRNDDQVQVRGFRIELGEIAAAVRRDPDVADATVRVTTDSTGRDAIVAYVVSNAGRDLDGARLITSLRTSLPAHMVPTDVVSIDAIPMTPNGKLDWRALPSPASRRLARAIEGGAPRDSLERLLVDVWESVLGRRPVGIHDDFFALGGYSLLATRLFAIVEERTGRRLPVSVLFEHPTIADLAVVIRDGGWRPSWSSLVPIQPAGTARPFFYVSPFMISVLELAPLGDELGDDQPLYGLQPHGLDGAAPPHATIEEMAAHYIAEMKSVQPEGPYLVGGHCSGSWVAFEMVRQLEAAGDELEAVVLVDQGPPGVAPPPVKPLRYIAHRIRYYLGSGRLFLAIAWKVKITVARHLLRRVGPPTARFEETVREAHRGAYRAYGGGRIDSDVTLVLSDDSMNLADKVWYRKWTEVTDGTVDTRHVGGTHANLLVQPYVQQLAIEVRHALDSDSGTDGDERIVTDRAVGN